MFHGRPWVAWLLRIWVSKEYTCSLVHMCTVVVISDFDPTGKVKPIDNLCGTKKKEKEERGKSSIIGRGCWWSSSRDYLPIDWWMDFCRKFVPATPTRRNEWPTCSSSSLYVTGKSLENYCRSLIHRLEFDTFVSFRNVTFTLMASSIPPELGGSWRALNLCLLLSSMI